MTKKRVLCLHGYHGSASRVLSQLPPMLTDVTADLELVAFDAPSIAAGDFGWWHGKFALWDEPFTGWDRTIDWAHQLFADQQFDGVIGMSQGAALAGLLTGLRAPDGVPTKSQPAVFDWIISIGGFVSDEPAHRPFYESTASYAIPSLHVMGRADSVVPLAEQQRFAALYPDATITEHPGDHIVPRRASIRTATRDFVDGVG